MVKKAATKRTKTTAAKRKSTKKATTRKKSTTTKRSTAKKATTKKSTAKKVTKRKTTIRKYSPKASKEVAKEMRRFKKGTAKSGKAETPVTSREQAIAIGLSKARANGAKVPKKRK